MTPLLAAALLSWAAGAAQAPPARPSARIGIAQAAPEIDGVPDEAAWDAAVRLDRFVEVEPVEGREASAPSEVWLMRDQRTLYLALVFVEPEPEGMVLQKMQRDAGLFEDDRIEFLFDTFHDGRSAYFFQLSASGSRGDALIGDGGQRFNKQWDTYWEGKSAVGAGRWTAEIAIPFHSLAFGPQDTWGANFERYRGADRSQSRWSGARRAIDLFQINQAGTLAGMSGMEQGLGLEFVPYVKLKQVDVEADDDNDWFGTGGGEVNWRVTPQLTASLTVNTDFAETEADQRQVNLTRFPLFFPEKRDFFLQDSQVFSFGESRRFGGGVNVLPFFSRRIGLAPDGREVPITGGLRAAGRVGALDLGLLGVHTEAVAASAVPAADLFVARPSYNVNERLAAGALFTTGHPYAETDSSTAGFDLRYSSADWLPGSFSWNSWWVATSDEASDDTGYAYGVAAALETSDWDFRFDTLATQGAFRPALGFVRRPGERRIAGSVDWEPRPGDASAVRNYAFGVAPELWTDLSGELQTYEIDVVVFGAEWNSGDALTCFVAPEGDRLDVAFSPVAATTIAAGAYDWTQAGIEFDSAETRPLNLRLELEGGSYYDGDAYTFSGDAGWRPDVHFGLALGYTETHANLPGGDFVTRLASLRLDYAFTPEVVWQNLLQGDNESDLLGAQSRLHWILEDGREAFLVLNSNWQELPGSTIVPVERDLTLKLVYSLRF